MTKFNYGDRLRLTLKDGKTVEGVVTAMGGVFHTWETPQNLIPHAIKTDDGKIFVIKKGMKICKLD